MGDSSQLEKMGRELKCPICLGLLNSAVSLSCNHVFCNSCISQSMKSHSNCPACKLPYRRREIRPAAHMDNLVSIYRSMEAASGFNIFVTQTAPTAKSPDKVKKFGGNTISGEEDTHGVREEKVGDRNPRNGKGSEKSTRKKQEVSAPPTAKPSFPTKKRVQVPQYPLSETPIRGEKFHTGSGVNVDHIGKSNPMVSNEKAATIENGQLVLSPLFWLRDESPERSITPVDDDEFLSLTSLSTPRFSDIKDSSDSESGSLLPTGEVAGSSDFADDSESELFRCTQKPSPADIFSTPLEMQGEQIGKVDPSHKGSNKDLKTASCPGEDNIFIPSVNRKPTKRLGGASGGILRRCTEMNGGTSLNKLGAPAVESGKLGRRKAFVRKNVSLNLERPEKTNLGTSADESELGNNPVVAEEAVSLADDHLLDGWGTSISQTQVSDRHHQTKKTRKVRRERICQSDRSTRLKKQKLESEEIIMAVEVCENSNKLDQEKPRCASFSTVHGIGKTSVADVNQKSVKHGKMLVNQEHHTQISERKTQCLEVVQDNRRGRKRKINETELRDGAIFGSEGTVKLAGEAMVDKLPSSLTESKWSYDQVKRTVKMSWKDTCKTDCSLKFKKLEKDCDKVKQATNECTEKRGFHEDKKPQELSSKVLAFHEKSVSDVNKKTIKHCEPQSNKLVQDNCRGSVVKQEILQCAFCHSPKISEASGEIVHYLNGRPVAADQVGQSKVIHCHKSCAEWAPNVYFEDDVAVNLEAELARSRRIKCRCCGLKGAALGCYDKSCRKSFHVPCAKMTPECRWDTENFVMLCPIHYSVKLPNEEQGSQLRNAERPKSTKCKQVFDGGFSRSRSSDSYFITDKLVLCCSALSDAGRETVAEFERVSGAKILKKFDSSVTHVIASKDTNGACKRTVKTLMGILFGKWILSIDWIRACMTATKIVQEESYEINVDIHGITNGPRLGRLRVLNKQPKILDGFKFYFMGDFVDSYKGYLQELITVAGGNILHRKPVLEVSETSSPSSTLVIYNLQLPEKGDTRKKDSILTQRRTSAKVLAGCTGAIAVSNLWVLDSIAASQLQPFL
ncbi:unnamed protein product [Linum tenue]|uniref:Uncharacterized protein n=1 Tax=Linum tenue TaxID=586396 RepID=A0AAV0QU05_9ROSI|nr:unnamed protein product [Linum tenue]